MNAFEATLLAYYTLRLPSCPGYEKAAKFEGLMNFDNHIESIRGRATRVDGYLDTLFTNQVMAWLRWGTGNEPPRGSVDILLQYVISEENPKAFVIREVDYIYHELLHQVTGLLIIEENK